MDGDDGSSSPASYIRLVQHLIEKCICYNMDKEECMETLEKHANIQPVITSTVWKELEKENREFFETYKKDRGEESSSEKNPSSEQSVAPSKSSDEEDEDENTEFFETYEKDRGEESSQKTDPSSEQSVAPSTKSSDEEDDDDGSDEQSVATSKSSDEEDEDD